MSSGNNSERVVIVTGSSRGLGREIALAFGRAGAHVVVNYKASKDAAEATAKEIECLGGQAVCIKADVGSPHEVDAMISETVRRWGRIDVLVNNAGMTKDGLLVKMPEQDWDEVIKMNLKAGFLTIRSILHVMIKQGRGHIINIASISGMKGREGQANYSAAKAGLIGLTKAAARELGRHNILVNAVLPGYLSTDMGRTVNKAFLERIMSENCLGRFSDPLEVAEFIRHLSGMRHVSGQVFNLDSRIVC